MLLLLIFTACSKMDTPYKDFIEGGKINYAAKADSVRVGAGRERIGMRWLLMSDPKINKAVIYWNGRQDSHVVAIERKNAIDTISIVIPQMPEGTYVFDIYTFDYNGNASIKVPVLGNIYGSTYEAGLLPRPVRSKVLKADTLRLQWYDAAAGVIGVETQYTDADGIARRFIIPKDTVEGKLPGVKAGGEVKLRTLFLPEAGAIDTFYTPFLKLNF